MTREELKEMKAKLEEAEARFQRQLNECKTVEEVEAMQCFRCSKTQHWGWCDAPNIKCEYKDRIKEILGKTDCTYTNEESILMCLEGEHR